MFEWFKDRYGLDIKEGDTVFFQGDECVIIGVRNGYLKLRNKKTEKEFLAHPTWEMEYPKKEGV
jgi:hypothetical protein